MAVPSEGVAQKAELFRWTSHTTPLTREVRATAAGQRDGVDHIVVLADQLTLQNSLSFEFGTIQPLRPKVTLIAHTLVVDGSVGIQAVWNKSDSLWTNAADFFVIAKTLHFRPKGDLSFNLIQARDGWGDVRVFYDKLLVDAREEPPTNAPSRSAKEIPDILREAQERFKAIIASVEPIRLEKDERNPSTIIGAKGRIVFVPFNNPNAITTPVTNAPAVRIPTNIAVLVGAQRRTNAVATNGIVRDHRDRGVAELGSRIAVRDHRTPERISPAPRPAPGADREPDRAVTPLRPALGRSPVFPRPSRLGKLELLPLKRAGDLVSPEILSEWSLEMQEFLLTRAQNAANTGDHGLAIQAYEKARDIAKLEWLPVGAQRKRFTEVLKGMTEILPPVLESRITVATPGTVDRTLSAFFEKRTLDYRLAPTDTLVVPRTREGGTVIGMVSFDTRTPEEIKLHFDVLLSVNPWLRTLAAERLAAQGLTLGGAFDNWKLSAPKLRAEGVMDSSIEVGASTLQCSLRLNRDLANIVLWRLRSSAGMPLSLAYECRADPAIKGELPLTLSFARRSEPELQLDRRTGVVTNRARTPLAIEYFMVGTEIVALSPARMLGPGQSDTLPIPAGLDPAKSALLIPPEAVAYTGGDSSSMDDLDFSGAGRLVEEVRLSNLLGADATLGGALEYVEVTITYILGEGPTATKTIAGPYRLSSRGTQGSEISVPFFRPNRGRYGFEVKGVAVWENGRQDIQVKFTDRLGIKIDESSFAR